MIKKQLSNGMGQIIINNDGLELLKKGIEKKFQVHVGILGTKTQRSFTDEKKPKEELTNAEIGAIHEFGIKNEKNRMPKRSFLEMPLKRSAKELFEKRQKLRQYLDAAIEKGASPEEAWRKAHEELGIVAEQIVQNAFEQSGPGWAALKKRKGKPLIDTGQMRRSIMHRVVTKQ